MFIQLLFVTLFTSISGLWAINPTDINTTGVDAATIADVQAQLDTIYSTSDVQIVVMSQEDWAQLQANGIAPQAFLSRLWANPTQTIKSEINGVARTLLFGILVGAGARYYFKDVVVGIISGMAVLIVYPSVDEVIFGS